MNETEKKDETIKDETIIALKKALFDVKGIIHNLFEFWDDDSQRTWYMNRLSDWMRKQKGLGL